MSRRLEHHPDKGGDAGAFQRISDAYAVLSDPQKRREYDSVGVVDDDQARSVPVVDPFELFRAIFNPQEARERIVLSEVLDAVAATPCFRVDKVVMRSSHRNEAFAFDSKSGERDSFDSDVELREAIERSKHDAGHAVDDEDLLLEEVLERSKDTVGVSEDDDNLALEKALRISERESQLPAADYEEQLVNQALELSRLELSSSHVEDDDDIRTAIAMSLET